MNAKIKPIQNEAEETETFEDPLNYIQTSIQAPKGQYNEFGKFNYRSCEDILQALKPYLEETGCKVVMEDFIDCFGEGEQARFYIKAIVNLVNPDNQVIAQTSAYAREPESKKGMDEMQLTGACSSYARKYALSGLFLLDDNKDADSMVQVTESDVEAFRRLIDEGNGAALLNIQYMDQERFLALSRAAKPKAGRTAFKKEFDDIVTKAVADAQTWAMRLIELAEKQDRHGLIEETEEMSDHEKRCVWRQLNHEQQDEIKRIIESE